MEILNAHVGRGGYGRLVDSQEVKPSARSTVFNSPARSLV